MVPETSARRDELLELAYRYVLQHGFVGISLRPLASAVGSSPRVLLFLFGSKDGLIRALLTRARADELALVERVRARPAAAIGEDDLTTVATQVWAWLAAPDHQPVLRLWVEAYARSLVEPEGSWAGFAQATVDDWLDLLAAVHGPPGGQDPAERRLRATAALAVLRGALLDLLATEDVERTTAAVHRQLATLEAPSPFSR